MPEPLDEIFRDAVCLEYSDRHPDVVRLLSSSEDGEHVYGFSGRKWPATTRRRRLELLHTGTVRAKVSGQIACELYRLAGTSIYIETFLRAAEPDAPLICRAFDATRESALGCDRPLEELTRQSTSGAAPATGRSTGGLTTDVSPQSRADTELSSASSAWSAFDPRYASLAHSEMLHNTTRYHVDVETAWARRPEISLERRAGMVDVIDGLVGCFGGSPATTHVAVNYLDRFLAAAPTEGVKAFVATKHCMRLLVCVVTHIALKNVDISWPTLAQLQAVMAQWERINDPSCVETLRTFEIRVLETLDYNLHPPTLRDAVASELAELNPHDVRALNDGMWLADCALRAHIPDVSLAELGRMLALHASGLQPIEDRFARNILDAVNAVSDDSALGKRRPSPA